MMENKPGLTPGRYAVGEFITWILLVVALVWFGDNTMAQLGAILVAVVVFLLINCVFRRRDRSGDGATGESDD